MRSVLFFLTLFLMAFAPTRPAPHTAVPILFDTDIGDDIDDAYALALLLHSPEVKILGITTAFGDTHLRARLVSRLLQETGHAEIPVYAGPVTKAPQPLSQAAWAAAYPDRSYGDAIAFMAATIRQHPGSITLLSVAPFTNVGALIRKDPAAFHMLKRVVIMGGSVRNGYGPKAEGHPDAEWNIVSDIASAQALFTSGIPLDVLPLDSTQVDLGPEERARIFNRRSPLTQALQELTSQWSAANHRDTPILFDAVAAAYTVHPELCPLTPLRLQVDSKGFTREIAGAPNTRVCLTSHADTFFRFYLPRIIE